jgi:hypothetical protein
MSKTKTSPSSFFFNFMSEGGRFNGIIGVFLQDSRTCCLTTKVRNKVHIKVRFVAKVMGVKHEVAYWKVRRVGLEGRLGARK